MTSESSRCHSFTMFMLGSCFLTLPPVWNVDNLIINTVKSDKHGNLNNPIKYQILTWQRDAKGHYNYIRFETHSPVSVGHHQNSKHTLKFSPWKIDFALCVIVLRVINIKSRLLIVKIMK